MLYEKIIDLALRRSFFFPTAELYGSLSGFYDYGPYGVALKQNFINLWRKEIVQKSGALEIDGANILPESVFKASGHLEHFKDPVVECQKCKALFRADKLLEENLKKQIPENLSEEQFDELIKNIKLKCPKCKGSLGPVKKLNLMFVFQIGHKDEEKAGLRPETCQNIFINFSRIYKTCRINLPIGIAQVGKAFRKEISPRQGLLRQREFWQAELEVFFNPKNKEFGKYEDYKNYEIQLQPLNLNEPKKIKLKDALDKKLLPNKLIAYYLALLQNFYENLGLKNFRFRELSSEEKAFYAIAAWDFEVKTEQGWLELVACNYRGDHDLKSHSLGSKEDLKVMDGNEKILPHVFELSMGIDRSIYVILEQSYEDEKKEDRIVLHLKPFLAPVFVQVCPLVNKDGLPELAKKIFSSLNSCYYCIYDDSGSIGKRYRRADEIGVPYVITTDYESKENATVTIRERDSMKQKRVKISDLPTILYNLYLGEPFENVK
ncbi:MAG: glycine--tRNA ligase [Candidatus Nanoarchaeia archaeon]